MKLSKSLIKSMAIGLTITATLSSCSVDLPGVDSQSEDPVLCEETKGNGDGHNWEDCPACGMG